MIAHRKLSVLALMSTLACQPLAFSQKFSGVLTWHNDNARTGLNSQEATLTPANVKTQTFGKLFSRPVQGQIYAQPLYVPNVSIPGEGKHNVVYVATEHDQLYAFDADGLVSQALWQDSFIDPAHGITTVSTQGSPCKSLLPEVGITSTPVIDGTSNTLYVVVETDENGTVAAAPRSGHRQRRRKIQRSSCDSGLGQWGSLRCSPNPARRTVARKRFCLLGFCFPMRPSPVSWLAAGIQRAESANPTGGFSYDSWRCQGRYLAEWRGPR